MFNLPLDIRSQNKTVTACLKEALAHYATGDKAKLETAAITALDVAVQLRDAVSESSALILIAASGHENGPYQLERANHQLWCITAPAINKAIAALSLARVYERDGERARAIALCQNALDHARQAMRDAAAMGDNAAYRDAQRVECAVHEMADEVILGM